MRLTYIEDNWYKFDNDKEVKKTITEYLRLLKKELSKEEIRTGIPLEIGHQLDTAQLNEIVLGKTSEFIDKIYSYYGTIFQKANNEKENIIRYLLKTNPELYRMKRSAFHNEGVEDQVKKVFEKNKIIQYKDELIQQVDPIYRDPDIEGFFNFRSHFYAPRKYFAGQYHDTYWFNMIFVWIMSAFLYITLYYTLLKKLLDLPEKIKFKK